MRLRPLFVGLGLIAQSTSAFRVAPLATMSRTAKRPRVDAVSMADATSAAPELLFEAPSAMLGKAAATVLVGRQEALLELSPTLLPAGMPIELWKALVAKVKPGDAGAAASTMFTTPGGAAATLVAAVLPEQCSRHNSPIRPHAITSLVGPAATDAAKEAGGAAIILVLDDKQHAAGAACAVARAFPLYSQAPRDRRATAARPPRDRRATVALSHYRNTAMSPPRDRRRGTAARPPRNRRMPAVSPVPRDRCVTVPLDVAEEDPAAGGGARVRTRRLRHARRRRDVCRRRIRLRPVRQSGGRGAAGCETGRLPARAGAACNGM